jgi:ribosomal protein L29
MNERYKNKIKGLNSDDLKKELAEKQKELMKNIIEAKKYGYAPTQTSTFHGNITRTRKQIAILLTKIKEKGVE